jgi:hypothetical protein
MHEEHTVEIEILIMRAAAAASSTTGGRGKANAR